MAKVLQSFLGQIHSLISCTGTYALPGGHLEYGESFEECAAREVLEETGLEVGELRFLTATNSVFDDVKKHYVTIFMGCRLRDDAAEPEVSNLGFSVSPGLNARSTISRVLNQRHASI